MGAAMLTESSAHLSCCRVALFLVLNCMQATEKNFSQTGQGFASKGKTFVAVTRVQAR
jgi:hypothetical protein